jgi:hypothetical protein
LDSHSEACLRPPRCGGSRQGSARASSDLKARRRGAVNRDEATLFTRARTIETEADYEAAVTQMPTHVTDALAMYPAASYPTVKDAYNALLTDLIFVALNALLVSVSDRATGHEPSAGR